MPEPSELHRRMLRSLWSLFRTRTPGRVTGAEPSEVLPCDWCDVVGPTTLEEVWSESDPAGRVVRLCGDCTQSCAAG